MKYAEKGDLFNSELKARGMQGEDECVDILSVKISRLDLSETIQVFKKWIAANEKHRVCVTPVNCLLWAFENKALRELYNSSSMNLPDGVPLLWASRLFKKPIRGRVTGLDLLPEFSRLANDERYKFFFLGAKEGVAEKLSVSLKSKFPNMDVVGFYSPPFADRFSEAENDKMISMINAAKPHVLWVSLTAPKQDLWIHENIEKINVNIAIGVGGAFEVTAGIIKRAPLWMQTSGLEWLFRFRQEPRRLFKRYFVEAPKFFPLIVLQKIGLTYKS